MDWWELGESTGFDGKKLALYRIHCAFCDHAGNFETIEHRERKNSATGKVLNYDTLQCGNCGNLTFAFWSAARDSVLRGMHSVRTMPWPSKTTGFPEHWPKDVGRFWVQAKRNLDDKSYDAASVMARSAVQLVVRYLKATGSNLKQEIDDLAKKGILPPVMQEWSHEVRALGNDGAHPTPGDVGTDKQEARDVVEFLTQLLIVTYNLPHEIEQYRKRRAEKE